MQSLLKLSEDDVAALSNYDAVEFTYIQEGEPPKSIDFIAFSCLVPTVTERWFGSNNEASTDQLMIVEIEPCDGTKRKKERKRKKRERERERH